MKKKFKISYRDPETGEQKVRYAEFEDWTGRSVIDGQTVGPIVTIKAYDWAKDFAYSLAQKGSFHVQEV